MFRKTKQDVSQPFILHKENTTFQYPGSKERQIYAVNGKIASFSELLLFVEMAQTKEHAHGVAEYYNVFWDECRSIHSEHDSHGHLEPETKSKELDEDNAIDDIEWLNDIGFTCVLMKYKNDDEIDPDGQDVQSMTATLTRRQSETVRKRIRSLNETLKRKRKDTPSTPRRPDVRDIFPAQLPSSISEEPWKDGETIEASNNNYYISLDSVPQEDLNCQDNVFDAEKIPLRSDAKPNDYSPRKLPEFIRTMFHTPELESKPQASQGLQRPPGPRRSKSEGVYKILETNESKSEASERPKLDKTQSEGSPTRSATGRKVIGRGSPQLLRRANDNFAESNEIGRIYGVSPQRLEMMRHKSAEDLLKITRISTEDIPAKSKDVASDKTKSDRLSIEGDAKLSFAPASTANDSLSSSFSGDAFPPLPNFTLEPETLGITRIADLSEPDLEKVRSLALIELTALFDKYNIAMKRRKQFLKPRIKESGIFGVPLNALPKRNEESEQTCSHAPIFFRDLIAFLETNSLRDEGLLRIPGSQQRIKAIREEIEDTYGNCDGCFCWQNQKNNDMATVLKQFLRELPTPLLTHEYQDTFNAVSELKDRKLQLQALNLLVLLLPPVHRDTLQLLLHFLSKVIAAENVNKMSLNNVAMIMAPNLFLRPNSRANLNEMNKAASTTNIMRMLIKYQKIIWTVPGFMVTQIRYIYEAGSKGRDSKAVRKIIAKRLRSENNPFSGGNQPKTKWFASNDELDSAEIEYEHIVRIKAPMCKKTCMAVQLTDYMTAAEIISRFRSKRKNSFRECRESSQLTLPSQATKCRSDSSIDKDEDDTFSLYEIGGNIGERCLDMNTNIAALLKANPNGELVLKYNP